MGGSLFKNLNYICKYFFFFPNQVTFTVSRGNTWEYLWGDHHSTYYIEPFFLYRYVIPHDYWIVFHWMDIPLSVYPFNFWWTFGLFPIYGYWKEKLPKYLCTNLGVRERTLCKSEFSLWNSLPSLIFPHKFQLPQLPYLTCNLLCVFLTLEECWALSTSSLHCILEICPSQGSMCLSLCSWGSMSYSACCQTTKHCCFIDFVGILAL